MTHDTGGDVAGKRRVVILGAGFGGINTALGLDDPAFDVLLIDRFNAQLFTPLLWTVADGRASAVDVMVPVRDFQRGHRFHFLQAEVQQIDLAARTVHTSAGPRGYDILVIALGSITGLPPIPGLKEHALLFRSPADALQLRNHLIDALEAAHRSDATEREAWLTFVVGGGGDTGVELAATIRDYLHDALIASYPWLVQSPPRVVVVEMADRLVPMGAQRESEAVQRILGREGIEIYTGTKLEGIDESTVKTSKGTIPARTVFWAAGIQAPPVVRDLPVQHAHNGAIIVDDNLRIPEHPEVFVVGDCAWANDAATGAPIPATAQAAEAQGKYLAHAISTGTFSGFRYFSRGHLTLLGRHTGLADVFGITFSGIPAWLLWHGYYLTAIPSWRNRFRLVADWLLSAIVGADTAQLPLAMPPRRDDG